MDPSFRWDDEVGTSASHFANSALATPAKSAYGEGTPDAGWGPVPGRRPRRGRAPVRTKGAEPIPLYRLYSLSNSSGRDVFFNEFEAVDDAAAIKRVTRGHAEPPMELRCNERIVERFDAVPRGDAAGAGTDTDASSS